jgi:hypothetical protein
MSVSPCLQRGADQRGVEQLPRQLLEGAQALDTCQARPPGAAQLGGESPQAAGRPGVAAQVKFERKL